MRINYVSKSNHVRFDLTPGGFTMPGMIRSKKSEKLIWKILQKPLNKTEKKSPDEERLDKQLLQQWTQRQR